VDAWKQRDRWGQACFDSMRDNKHRPMKASTFFDETAQGAHCDTNWYEGNTGILGAQNTRAKYSADAPAVLGFDETIDQYCERQPKVNVNKNEYSGAYSHAFNCVAANVNILSLYGQRLPYNLCRNFEWQTCAALGNLPGQGFGKLMVFSKAPNSLRVHGNKPFGQCKGWREPNAGSCEHGYATDDIYFLEVCTTYKICENGDEIFDLIDGQSFKCQPSARGFAEIRDMLLARPASW